MFKFIGAIIVIGAAGLIGMSRYSQLYERKRTLSLISDGAEKIHNNLKCMCMPLYECFLSGGEFFSKAAKKIADGASPGEAVREVAYTMSYLTQEDISIIERFSEGLSAHNCDGQMRNTELFIKELSRNIEKSAEDLETKGKLTVKGSILAAAAVVLVLI